MSDGKEAAGRVRAATASPARAPPRTTTSEKPSLKYNASTPAEYGSPTAAPRPPQAEGGAQENGRAANTPPRILGIPARRHGNATRHRGPRGGPHRACGP